ncbi:MAG: hypothetical protein V4591_07190 [Bdellovibrionota bacterium]
MYDASLSYEENYAKGPFPLLTSGKKFPKIKYTDKPKFEFLGIPLHIPFGVPAGPLLNSKFVKVALDAGFCLPIYKTVRSSFWACNAWPNVLNISAENKSLFADNHNKVTAVQFDPHDYSKKNISISNSFGAPSQSPDVWTEDFYSLLPYSSQVGSHVVLSFQGSRIDTVNLARAKEAFYEDAQKACELAVNAVTKTGFHVLEINLSCPNESQLPIYKDVPNSIKLLAAVNDVIKKHKHIKLVVKIGSLSNEEIRMLLSEASEYMHAVSAINTISADILSKDGQVMLGSKAISGGVCGSLIFEQGVRMTSMLAQEREKLGIKKQNLGIIGVGGVMSADNFASYLNAGADVVQAATGMMWNLNLAQDIANYLKVSYILEN